jgi:succinate dehydrogenase / fumarate reductase membrane anchor subunit
MKRRFETLGWYAMRVSGVLLTVAVTVHMYWNTVLYDDVDLTWDVIVRRYYNPWWRLFDLALLGFTIFHGFYGLRQILVDHLPIGTKRRILALTAFHGLWIGLLVFGTFVIMSFPWPPGVPGTQPVSTWTIGSEALPMIGGK